MKKPLLICDLDGTLANASRRYEVAGAEPDRLTDAAAHDAWLARVQSDELLAADEVVPLMPFLVTRLKGFMDVAYLTARSDNHFKVTLEWIGKKGFPLGDLVMRAVNDKRPTRDYKHAALLDLIRLHDAKKVMTLDDDHENVMAAVYKQLGILHLKPTFCAFDLQYNVLPAYATVLKGAAKATQPTPEEMMAAFKKESA